MPIPSPLLERIAVFRSHRESYQAPDYKEFRLREEFLNPLFEALGWDIANNAGYAEAYKDVVHEDTLKISGVGTVAPDLSFRIGGTRKFFVEAKKPAVSIKDDPVPAAQLRRYSWSAKLPLGIVTDFEEFAIYDTRVRPREGDKASTARLFYCTFEQLPEHWDFIAGIFSRDAVLRGGFDKFAAAKKGKRGTAEFDDEFLKDMEQWRELLARNLALRNSLSQRDLNFAVQRILDRIIFLRIAEDRGVESFGQLQALTAGNRIYPRFCDLCRKADLRYNSGLFHFEKEKGRDESPDGLTLGLELDDATLKEIISSLYYPKSPYAFAVIPADILGHVYEKFLGKVIHLTSEHRVKIEEKPEVRKAGGVYYTPTYIVNYIVAQTVGPLVAGKTPKQVEKLRVLDPACGSGSFLLGAFEFLLDWHLRYYLANDPESWAKKKNPPLYETAPNARFVAGSASDPTRPVRNWQLTTAERKRILVNNLYGVDIDAQAVEVTKLSLLLKVLEGEAREMQGKQLDFHRVLPDLGKNIKCGNSLIGSDFYAQPNLPELDDEARYKINAFDWKHEFAEIMSAGGFDAVIGNPPYVRIQTLSESDPQSADFLISNYSSAQSGNFDLYVVFAERALSLLNGAGKLGYILPHKFFNAKYGAGLRTLISSGRHVTQIVHFGHQQVFEAATTYTCLLFLQKAPAAEFDFIPVADLLAWRAGSVSSRTRFPAKKLSRDDWVLGGGYLLEKLQSHPTKLENVTKRIFQGLKTSADKIYIVEERARAKQELRIWSPQLESEFEVEPALFHPLVKGGDSRRYALSTTSRLILFPYAEGRLIPSVELEKRFPLTWAYLKANKGYLEGREDGKMRGDKWYGYVYPKALEVMHLPKIFTPDIALRPAFSYDSQGTRFFTGGVSGGYGVLPNDDVKPSALLGLLNSKVLGWIVAQTATQMRGGYFSFEARFIRSLPIRLPDAKSEKATHDTLVAHVERMLKLHEQLAAAKSPDALTHLQREIAATDRAIDQLVYRLYDLTPEEIALVEAATAPAAPRSEASAAEGDAAPALPAPGVPPAEIAAGGAAGYDHHFLAKEEPPAPANL